MANEYQSGDIAAIIKDLMNRRALLDAAIANLQALTGERVQGSDSGSGTGSSAVGNGGDQHPTELPRGAFLGKSIPAAIKLYLYAMKRKQTDREIATALREGGVESTSDNFEKVVTGCLNRMKMNGEVLRFKDGWGLTEFYPAHLRSSLSQEGSSKRKIITKKKPKKAAAKPKAAASGAPVPQSQAAAPGVVDRIVAYVEGHKGEWVTFHEVVAAFPGNDSKMIALNLGKSAKKHGWEKSPEGHYRAISKSV